MRVPRRPQFRRRYLVILILLAMFGPVAALWYNSQAQSSLGNAQRVAPPPSPYCQKDDPLAGVGNPISFRVIKNCEVGTGFVASVALQNGIQLVNVTLDGSIDGSRLLVLEITSQDLGTVSVPSVGQHIRFVGPLVYDISNGWKTIRPVWSITILNS